MYSNTLNSAKSDYIPDVKTVLLMLWRHRRLMTVIVAVSMVFCSAFILSMPRNYKASAIVMLNESPTTELENFKDVAARPEFDTITLQTEVKMLNSPSLMLRTIRATSLGRNEEFSSDDEREVVRQYAKHLGVAAQGQSRIIEVSFKSEDPETAAKVTNAHVQEYLAAQIEFKKQQTEKLSEWFETKVNDLKEDVAEKAQAVQEFRAEEGLPLGKDNSELVYQEISDVAMQLVPVQVYNDGVQAKLAAINAAGKSASPDALPEVVASPLIQNLKTQASIAAQKVQSLSAQYGPNHPKLATAQRELEQVNAAIDAESANIKSSVKNEAAAAKAQENALKGRLRTLNDGADDMRAKLVTLNGLQVEQLASQKVLDDFLENYKNIQSQITLSRPDAIVVSAASVPILPVAPGRTLLVMIAAVFSVSLALVAVFAIEMMKGGVRNFEDVRKFSQKPLGIIPRVSNPSRAILGSSDSYRESVKRIYMSGLLNNPARTVLVTSALPQEGRTTVVQTMALYLVSLGHKVAVIDADFLKPSLTALAEKQGGPGFTDLLSGYATLDDVISVDGSGFSIIPAGSLARQSPDDLHTDKLRKVLGDIRQRFDYVLIDSGPLLARSEAGVIATGADGILVVTQWMKTSQENSARMFELLNDTGAPILGVVINKVDIVKYKNAASGSDFLLPKTANAA